MIPLTDEEIEFYKRQKVCLICKKEFCNDEKKKKEFKLYQKVRDHCHYTRKFRGAAHSICNLKYKVPKESPVVFHNGSTYDYHFMIKQLAEEFKGQMIALEKIQKNILLFQCQLKKNDNGKTSTYKIKFIDSYRFMPNKFADLTDNLSELMIKNANHAWKEKELNQNVILLG